MFSRWKFIYFFYGSASEGRNVNSNCKLLACTHTPLIFNFCKVCKRTVAAAVISLELASHLNIYLHSIVLFWCANQIADNWRKNFKMEKYQPKSNWVCVCMRACVRMCTHMRHIRHWEITSIAAIEIENSVSIFCECVLSVAVHEGVQAATGIATVAHLNRYHTKKSLFEW